MDIIKKCKSILMDYEDIIFAYIFGSYVQGKMRADSDIDIAIYLENKMDAETYLEIKTSFNIPSDQIKEDVKIHNYWNNIYILCQRKPLMI